MQKNTLFLRWLLFATIIAVGLLIVQKMNLFAYIYRADITKLSFLIIALCIWMTIFAGRVTRKIDVLKNKKHGHVSISTQEIEFGLRHINFAADISAQLGLLGTIAGFLFVFGESNLEGIGTQNLTQLFRVIWQGASTALITTCVGIISTVILKVQFHVLDICLERYEKK